MKSRLLPKAASLPVLGLLATLATIVTFAAHAPAARAQFGIGAISGTVSGPLGPLEGVQVNATPFGGGGGGGGDTTGPDGTYVIVPLSAGNYRLSFNLPGYIGEYYDDVLDPAAASAVTVAESATTSGIDAVLDPEATISGTVTDSLAQPKAGVCVSATPTGGGATPGSVTTDAEGEYMIANLIADSYTIKFDPCDSAHNLDAEWWDNQPSAAAADPVTLAVGESRTGIDASLSDGGSISGTVLDSNGDPAADAQINVWTAFGVIESRAAAGDGTYTVDQLATGSYSVEFVPPPGSLDLPEYYDDQTSAGSATPVAVTAGVDTGGIDAQLNPDLDPPEVTIDAGPAGPTNDTTPTFDFTTEVDATVECSIDAGVEDYGPCSDAASHTAATLSDGPYTFRVRATDPSGNLGDEATRDFIVDTQPPAVSVTGGPSGPTGITDPTFTFSAESGASVECAVDPAAAVNPGFGSCTTPGSHTSAPLGDGDYVFRVRATDAASNEAVAQRAFTVDSDGPTIQITSGPTGPTNDATPSFGFSASQNATFECAVDPVGAGTPSFGACSGAFSHTSTPLPQGSYVFRVRASDDAAHANTALRSFSVDTALPTLVITSGPAGETADPMPSFTFNAEPTATILCSLDSGSAAFGSCSSASGHTPPVPLADGSYTFRVRATDAAGNSATATRSFEVAMPGPPPVPDTTPPTVAITGGPKGKTKDSTPKFKFESNDTFADFSCKVDGRAAAACNSPLTLKKLKPGKHQFSVTATDDSDNTSAPATQKFTVKKKKRK